MHSFFNYIHLLLSRRFSQVCFFEILLQPLVALVDRVRVTSALDDDRSICNSASNEFVQVSMSIISWDVMKSAYRSECLRVQQQSKISRLLCTKLVICKADLWLAYRRERIDLSRFLFSSFNFKQLSSLLLLLFIANSGLSFDINETNLILCGLSFYFSFLLFFPRSCFPPLDSFCRLPIRILFFSLPTVKQTFAVFSSAQIFLSWQSKYSDGAREIYSARKGNFTQVERGSDENTTERTGPVINLIVGIFQVCT